jgi:chemotaxis signal transduction protein
MNDTELSPHSQLHPTGSAQRFLLVRLEGETLVFPSDRVSEILTIERSRILNLPFYAPAVIGCVHQAGRIILLISLRQSLNQKPEPNREILTVIRLSELAGNLAGVGLAIDRVLASQERAELPADFFNANERSSPIVIGDYPARLFQPEMLNANLWQPRSYGS